MLRRLHPDQPKGFAFTSANQKWAKAQITKYPKGREASAIIPLLWRAQEQEGWLSRPAIETVADMLGLAHIRALEVASFYFMFQLQPVGSVAHIQVCGTTSCMICGAEDLIGVCREKIAANPHEISADGKLSWEEVECLGACANAPMAQIGKDYFEDLTAERFSEMIDDLRAGNVPTPGPQNGRFASEPLSGLTSLDAFVGKHKANGSVERAIKLKDSVKRIDGKELPIIAPWHDKGARHKPGPNKVKTRSTPANIGAKPIKIAAAKPASKKPARAMSKANTSATKSFAKGKKPRALKAPRKSGADDLKLIKGIGPSLEKLCHKLGYFHFDQVAKWNKQEVAWVDENLEGFKGRVTRDKWVSQAKTLASGKQTEFSRRSKKGSG